MEFSPFFYWKPPKLDYMSYICENTVFVMLSVHFKFFCTQIKRNLKDCTLSITLLLAIGFNLGRLVILVASLTPFQQRRILTIPEQWMYILRKIK